MSINIKKKPYPYGFTQDTIDIIDMITISKGNPKSFVIQGSAGLTSQLYFADYDLLETITEDIFKNIESYDDYIDKCVKRLQNIIKTLLAKRLVYIGDIKAGEIPKWNVSTLSELTNLHSNNIITDVELENASNELKCKVCFRSRRFGVIRWTPADILKGFIILRDGSKFTLKDAIKSKSGLTKLDVIAYVDNKFTEFSIIYRFTYKDNDISDSFKQMLLSFHTTTEISYLEQKYFKVIKRLFSIAKQNHNTTTLTLLTSILNSELGRIYTVISDINTIIYILENVKYIPSKRIDYEIQEFKPRLSNIYTLEQWVKLELPILKHINSIQYIKSRVQLIKGLTTLKVVLNNLINYYSLQFLIDNNICAYGCTFNKVSKTEIINTERYKKDIIQVKNDLDKSITNL
jgi:hypothetical protein